VAEAELNKTDSCRAGQEIAHFKEVDLLSCP